MEVVAQAGVEETPEAFIVRRDGAIKTWLDDSALLSTLKPKEMASRKAVTEVLFPNPVKGTQRYTLNGGYAVKLVHGTTYSLGDKDKADTVGNKIPVFDQVTEMLERIGGLGNRGVEMAANLVKFKPELSESVYLALDVSLDDDKKIKAIVDEYLTTKPASPTLTFETPK